MASRQQGVGRSWSGLLVGRTSKWLVLGSWVVVLAVAFAPSSKLTGAQKNDAISWLPRNAESTQVLKVSERFQSSDEIPAVVVYEKAGTLSVADVTAVTGQVKQFDDVQGVDRAAVGPIPSKDGKALEVYVPINAGSGGWDALSTAVETLRDIAATSPPGVTVHFTGPGGFAADSASAFSGIDGKLLYSAMAVVVVILLFTYRSPVLWLLPVISAVVALTSAQAVIYLLATHAGLTVNAQSAGILTVLVFGAGTDYALLLVARFREELRRHEAMAVALHRSGPAILASGSTVVAGMLCLLTASLNSTLGLGPVAAVGIGVCLLVMLTLLPAILVCCGRWVFWPVRPSFGSADHTETGLWARVGSRIASGPRLTWVATVVALGVASLGLFSLNASGLSNKDSFYGNPDSVVGEQALARHFPAGSGQPLVVVTKASAAGTVTAALSATTGIAEVSRPRIAGGVAYLEGTLDSAPDSQAAKDTVDRARTAVHAVPGADAKVGGGTAIVLDTLRANSHDNVLIIPVVLLVVLLILGLLLRSVVAPLVLVATVVLSYMAALGLGALLFRHVFGFAGADASLPLFVFVFLVALGIDYNIFLMTRVHEETKKVGTRRGALVALAATGGVITSAGLVLAGTFAVLGTLPVVTFAEIGIAVALGVLLDTVIVRAVLVTSLTLDLGRVIWWPSTLARHDGEAEESERQAPALSKHLSASTGAASRHR